MSFKLIECVILECDGCEEIFELDHSIWPDEKTAWELAEEEGWTKEGNNHFCSNCSEKE